MNEKNLKLLEIAGCDYEVRDMQWNNGGGPHWIFCNCPNQEHAVHDSHYSGLILDEGLPYNSLDALCKWVVPKVLERGYSITLYCQTERMCSAHLFKSYHDEELGEDDHLAHALAEAILKAWEEK